MTKKVSMSPGSSRIDFFFPKHRDSDLHRCLLKHFPENTHLAFFCHTRACGIPPYQEPPFSKQQQPCHALGSALPMAGTGPTPSADSHSLFQDHLPQRRLHPCSKQQSERVNTVPFTCGQVLFLHFTSAFIPHPPPPLCVWLVSPLTNTATISWAKCRSIFSEVTKKRKSAKEQNYTETEYGEGKINSASSEYKNYSSCSTQVTTQTFATPTPVNRASNSSCRRGSRLWSSSIMAAETRGQIKEDIAGAGSVVIVKWESCLTVSSDMMSHGCI